MTDLDEMHFQYEESYALSEFLEDPSFQTYCIRGIIHWRKNVLCHWPSFAEAKIVYEKTKGSMLRKLVADTVACKRSQGGNE